MRRSFIGLFFIILAITTLLDGFSIFPNGSIFLAICTVVLGFFAIRGLMDFDSFGTIFPLALLFYVYNKNYHFANISGWKIFLVAIFLSTGISMILPRRYKYKEFRKIYRKKVYMVNCMIISIVLLVLELLRQKHREWEKKCLNILRRTM